MGTSHVPDLYLPSLTPLRWRVTYWSKDFSVGMADHVKLGVYAGSAGVVYRLNKAGFLVHSPRRRRYPSFVSGGLVPRVHRRDYWSRDNKRPRRETIESSVRHPSLFREGNLRNKQRNKPPENLKTGTRRWKDKHIRKTTVIPKF